MTNLEIDQKLAKAMGYKDVAIRGTSISGKYATYRDTEGVLWKFQPTEDMEDAWHVAERFGLINLYKTQGGEWTAVIESADDFIDYADIRSISDTAPLAICKAALKVIEGSESDE